MTTSLNLQTIADSGQCFRLNRVAHNNNSCVFLARSADKAVLVRQYNDGEFDFVGANSREMETTWKPYFDLNTDYQSIYDKINASNDQFLKDALAFSDGMRILKQDFWEALVSFLISQNSNILKITLTIENLCEQFGKPIQVGGILTHTFPTKEELDQQITKFSDLDGIGLGYRQKYLYMLIKADSSDIVPEYKKLLKLHGIGPKAASCALLYGNHDMTQFPIDTWMKKLINDIYGGSFNIDPYKEWAGFVQQIMFYYYRHLKGVK